MSLTVQVQALFAKYSGIGVMYDFADISTLRALSNGTGSVASVSDPVGWVADLNTGAYPATQSDTTKRPLWNGAGITPDGVNDTMTTASIDFTSCDKLVMGMGYTKIDDTIRFQIGSNGSYASIAGAFVLRSGQDGANSRFQQALSRGVTNVSSAGSALFTTTRANGFGAHSSRNSIPGDLSEVWWAGVKGNNGVASKGGGALNTYGLVMFAASGSSQFSNTPARRAIVMGIPVASAQMDGPDIAIVQAWLAEGA